MAEEVLSPDITGDGKQDLDITDAGDFGTIGGAVFTDAVNTGSGTGGYNTFLAIQDNNDAGSSEAGFNSDDTPPLDTTNVEMDQAKSHTVKLSDLVVKTIDGVQYYEFRVDLNESNSDPNAQISLDQFKLFSSTNPDIESTTQNTINKDGDAGPSLFSQHVIYDMDAGGDVSVLMSDAGSTGSGTDDYAVLVPVSKFVDANGDPLNPATTYIYLYVEMGAADTVAPDTWGATSTFEEWNLENGVTLAGTKFADLNGNGVRDAGEGPVEGVTIFIDSNTNGTLDAGERTTVTDASGNYSFFGVALNQTVWIDEDLTSLPAGTIQTTGAHEVVTISSNATPGSIITVDPIGNFIPAPAMNVTKAVSSITGGEGVNGLTGANSAGDVIHYNISVQNTGNVALTGLTITDPNANAGSIQPVTSGGFNTGDTDHDNVFDAGETWNFTAAHTVTQPELDGKGIDIAGAIDGDGDDDNRVTADTTETAPDTADAAAPLIYNPAMNVTKAVTSITGGQGTDGLEGANSAGDVIHYGISVQNTGNITLTGLTVIDPNADAGSIVEVKVGGFNTGDTDSDGKFDVGETWNFTATHTVTQPELDGKGINIAGVIDGDGDDDNRVTADTTETAPDTADAAAPLIYNPALTIDKVVQDVSGDGADGVIDSAGDIITYDITVTNTGNITLTNVTITDPLTGGLLHTVASLAPGASYTQQDVTYTVTQDDLDSNGTLEPDNVAAALIDNTAVADSDQTGSVDDSEDVPIDLNPGIAIEKTAALDDGGDCVDQDGDIINYTYSVTNTGNVALDNVVVVDDKVTVVADDADLDGHNDGDTDADGLLDVNETWTYSASYTATQDDIDNNGDGNGFIHNNVTANGDAAVSGEAALEATDDADVEVCPAPAIAIEKTAVLDDGGDCVDQDGDIINYTYSVTNAGNVALDNVVVVDDKVTVVADDADLDGHNDGDTDADGLLDVNETWTYSASYTATQADIDNNGDGGTGFIHNNVTANGEAAVSGEAALEATDDADVEVCPAPAIAIEKTATLDDGGDCVDQDGDIINYTYSVTNAGNVALDNVVVVDDKVTVVADDADLDGHNDGDTDADGLLDLNETWTYTASYTATQDDIDNNGDGNGFIHNNVTANGDSATSGEAALEATDDADVEVCQLPGIAIEKTAALDDGGDCVDQDGDIINYTYSVTNTGNVALDNVVVVDDKVTVVADDADLDGHNDGDTDADGLLDVNETWTYSASYTATQTDIDNNGDGGTGFIHNNVTANGEAAVSGEAALEATDDADVEVCPAPGIDLEKYVAVDSTDGTDGTFVDADSSLGPQNVNLGADVWFKVTVENTGNVTLTDVDIKDVNQSGGGSVNFDLMLNGALTADATGNHSATLDGDTDGDGDLDVGETWTIVYRQAFDPGEHLNVATVTTAEEQTDNDAAYYFSLVDEGLCPRTPGFWQNPKNGGQFWDGIANNEKHAGQDGFPDGELLYAVDSNHDGAVNGSDAKGLLIGDYNHNGLTDAGEDTLFVSYADARSLINASNKEVGGDGRFMLGRDMVATWLNSLQGSGIGDASDPQSPHHYLDDAIDWMQIYSGKTAGGNSETFDALKLTGGAIKTSTATYNTPQAGIDHSAGQMHSALDYYNNTGQTQAGGTHYANCACDCLDEALAIYQQAHSLV